MSSSRRSVLQALAGMSVAVIAVAGALPVALRKIFDDAREMATSVLFIPSGETVTISSTDSDTYTAIEWEQSGTLNWEQGGSIQLEDTA